MLLHKCLFVCVCVLWSASHMAVQLCAAMITKAQTDVSAICLTQSLSLCMCRYEDKRQHPPDAWDSNAFKKSLYVCGCACVFQCATGSYGSFSSSRFTATWAHKGNVCMCLRSRRPSVIADLIWSYSWAGVNAFEWISVVTSEVGLLSLSQRTLPLECKREEWWKYAATQWGALLSSNEEMWGLGLQQGMRVCRWTAWMDGCDQRRGSRAPHTWAIKCGLWRTTPLLQPF